MAELAHELNSLLDGSIRCVALAEKSLESGGSSGKSDLGAVFERLQKAKIGLRDMAELLERALHGAPMSLDLFGQDRALPELVDRTMDMVRSMAKELGVELATRIDSACDEISCGPLAPVLLNGLRNAIRAAAQIVGSHRRVELVVRTNDKHELEIAISDTGPGLPRGFAFGSSGEPDGHGIGLELSRRIVTDLGGNITLKNSTSGTGAILCVAVPQERLKTS